MKQSQTAAVPPSFCSQGCVGPLAACHEHPVVSFLWDGQAVSQHISKHPNATVFTTAEGLVEMGYPGNSPLFLLYIVSSPRGSF